MRINLDANLRDSIICSLGNDERWMHELAPPGAGTRSPNFLFERSLNASAFRVISFGMPQLAAALSITNMMNHDEHLFYFFIPIEAAHRPATSSSDLLNLEEESLPQN